jgi:hypothetical protein
MRVIHWNHQLANYWDWHLSPHALLLLTVFSQEIIWILSEEDPAQERSPLMTFGVLQWNTGSPPDYSIVRPARGQAPLLNVHIHAVQSVSLWLAFKYKWLPRTSRHLRRASSMKDGDKANRNTGTQKKLRQWRKLSELWRIDLKW